MKLSSLIVAAPIVFSFSDYALAVQSRCIVGVDWHRLCDLPEAPYTRCVIAGDNNAAMFICNNETDGCAAIGGCFGSVPPGYWYPVSENQIPYKCRCGCFAKETVFIGADEKDSTGESQIASRKTEGYSLLSMDSYGQPWSQSAREVNGLTFGPSKETSFKLTTQSGRSVTLSPAHPVLVALPDGTPHMMKKASEVSAEDLLLRADGIADAVVKIEQIEYRGLMMNFNVKSASSAHHIIPANGLLLGDSAWQERLSAKESRILLRAHLAAELLKREKVKAEN
ncbi:MAG: hypothetical protein RLZZ488_1937 [Pseudomonadota bacterium]|jgi:hypothetical protein